MSLVSAPRPSPGNAPVRGARLLRLGSVLGVPIFVTPSWLFVAGFIVISYSDFLRSQVRNLSPFGAYALALVFAVLLAASVLAHELGHTVVSKAVGLPVNRIVVFLLGGVSEIEGEPHRPRDELAIAAAGPAVSFLLAAACWGAGLPFAGGTTLAVMLALLAWSNLVIGIFNVLPGLPLDGGRVIQSIVWMVGRSRSRATVVAAWCGRVLALLLGASVVGANMVASGQGSLSFTSVGAAAMGFAVAAFLWMGATQSLRAGALADRASALHIPSLIRPTVFLPGNLPLSEALRRLAECGALGIVVIDAEGRSRAIARESQIRDINEAQRPWTSLAEVSRPLEPGLIIGDDIGGAELLERVRSTPASEYLVVGRDGISRGLIATTDLARTLELPRGGATG